MFLRKQDRLALAQSDARQAGFSIVELMIVVAIIGLLAAIVIPSYREQVNKAKRATSGKPPPVSTR